MILTYMLLKKFAMNLMTINNRFFKMDIYYLLASILHYICYITLVIMARGDSGRIVIEIDPKFKKDLYLSLAQRDLTMKDWFMKQAEEFIENGGQLNFFQDNQIEKTNG